jgi:small subunit ribosomal protein S17
LEIHIQKSKIGRVVSDKMQKTVVVAVENQRRHPIYQRLLRRTVRFKAHDETNDCRMGDIVRIIETRPLSREKRWRVAEIVERADTVEAIDEQAV